MLARGLKFVQKLLWIRLITVGVKFVFQNSLILTTNKIRLQPVTVNPTVYGLIYWRTYNLEDFTV